MAGKDMGPVIGTIGGLVGVGLGTLLMALLVLVATPVSIRAGLAQDFAAGFDLAWAKDFIAKTWVEVLISTLVLIVVSCAIVVCTCFIGLLVVIPLVPLVQAHLWYQFYTLYLARGGMPVAVKAAVGPSYGPPPPV